MAPQVEAPLASMSTLQKIKDMVILTSPDFSLTSPNTTSPTSGASAASATFAQEGGGTGSVETPGIPSTTFSSATPSESAGSTTSRTASSGGDSASRLDTSDGLSTGATAGIAVAAVLVGLAIIGLVLWLWLRNYKLVRVEKRRKQDNQPPIAPHYEGVEDKAEAPDDAVKYEVDGVGVKAELEAKRELAELPGSEKDRM